MKAESNSWSDTDSVPFRTAVGWSYLMRVGEYAITTVVTFVLAAIVGPEAFGLVAMALVYLMFIQMLVRQGMVSALIQRRQLDEIHINSAFWLVIASGIVLAIASVAVSGWWAQVNRTPGLEGIIDALSVIVILQSLIVVQEALMSRRMDFRALAIRTNSAALVGGGVGLLLALTGFGVWALVGQHIVKAVVEVLVLWGLSDWRPKIVFSWSAARELLGVSVSMALVGFGSFVNNRADALLIGVFFGPLAVGLYRLAARLIDVLVSVTARPMQSVSLPELSRLQHETRRLADRIVDMVNSTSMVAFPLLGILAGASSQFVAVLGPEWAPAGPTLSLLSIVGGITVVTIFTGPTLVAVGRAHTAAVLTWVVAIFSALSFVVAGILVADLQVSDQVIGVAIFRVVVFSTAVLGLSVWATLRFTETTLSSLARAVWLPLLVAGFAFASAQVIASFKLPGVPWVDLALVAGPATIMTAALLLIFAPKLRMTLTGIVRRRRPG